jgi:phage FluMu protein Com
VTPSVDTQDNDYYIVVKCPHCGENNMMLGCRTIQAPFADAMRCFMCKKLSWLGTETSNDFDGDIESDSVYIEEGLLLV